MANLEQLISKKTAADTEWKVMRQMERDNMAGMRDAEIVTITSSPEEYAKYLEMQGSNLTYSAGNVALVMAGLPEATQFGTRDRWRVLGRAVLEEEKDSGVKIFAKATYPNRGYVPTDAYDITQTQGRAVKETVLRDNTPQMEAALATLLNYAVVPVVPEKDLSAAAYYDQNNMELVINPAFSDSEAFSAIATEIAHARLHNKGFNRFYVREEYKLDADSISYILCKHFHVERPLPDTSCVAQLYEGWDAEGRTEALDKIHEMSKQIGRSIDLSIAPQQQQRGRAPMPRPAR